MEVLVDWARRTGARVCGHGAGCRGDRYAAFASVVDNDHEAIDAEGVLERLDAGVHVIARCGTGRDDVPAVADVIEAVDPTDVSLSTDDLSPRDLLSRGHMDDVVRRAIEAGLDPVDAVRMATVAPARHFDLARGTLAPGAVADVVVLEDLAAVSVGTVLADGEVVVESGEPLVGPRPHTYPESVRESVPLTVPGDAFAVAADAARDGTVRVIKYGNGFVTSSGTATPPREDGELLADGDAGVCKAALCSRHPRREASFTRFLTNFGLRAGAVATSITREVPGTVVVGADEGSMRRAAVRVGELGGGCILADGEEVVREVALPIGGVATNDPLPTVADRFDAVEQGLRRRGVEHDRPLLGVEALSFPGVPSLKLSFSGYADVLKRDVVGLALPGE